MGLFEKKQKITVNDMAMKMMLTASETIGKLTAFGELSEAQNIIVGMGYFYGYMKINLISITSLNIAEAVVDKSIAYLADALESKSEFRDAAKIVKSIANKTVENMKIAVKNSPQDPFMGMSIFYMSDMYGRYMVNVDKIDVSINNLRLLYGVTTSLTRNVKILD